MSRLQASLGKKQATLEQQLAQQQAQIQNFINRTF